MKFHCFLVLALGLLAIQLSESAVVRLRREVMEEGKDLDTNEGDKDSTYNNHKIADDYEPKDLSRDLEPPPFALYEMQPPPVAVDSNGYHVPAIEVIEEGI